MQGVFQIAEIIKKHIEGSATPAEKETLDAWLAADARHREMFAEFVRDGYVDERAVEHAAFDVDKGYRRFMRYKRGRERRRTTVRWSAAAAVVLLASAGVWLMLDTSGGDSLISQARPGSFGAVLTLDDGRQIELGAQTASNVIERQDGRIVIGNGEVSYETGGAADKGIYNKLTTPRGAEHRVTLSDGTRVWLNAETELRYPAAFDGELREVWIAGEAYFEVAADAVRPFVVNTEKMALRVLGTSFNVRAYPAEAEQATLVEGRVRINVGEGDYILTPGDQLNVADGGVRIEQVNIQAYQQWKHERFVFYNERLEDVLRKVERWYNVPIVTGDPALSDLRFTGSIPKYENMDGVLRKLELTTRIRFEERGGTVTVVQE